MTLMSRGEFLKPAVRRYKNVPLPVGGTVRIQSLTAGESRSLKESLSDSQGRLIVARGRRLNYLLIAAAVVDESGQKLFSDADAMGPDMDGIDNANVVKLSEEIKNHIGFTTDADFSAIEAAIKNSESTPEN